MDDWGVRRKKKYWITITAVTKRGERWFFPSQRFRLGKIIGFGLNPTQDISRERTDHSKRFAETELSSRGADGWHVAAPPSVPQYNFYERILEGRNALCNSHWSKRHRAGRLRLTSLITSFVLHIWSNKEKCKMRLTTSFFVRWNPLSVKYANLPDRYIKRTMEQVSWTLFSQKQKIALYTFVL